MNGEQIWQAAQEELRFQLSKPSYETWLKNASLVGREKNAFKIGVPTKLAKDWLRDRYSAVVKETVSAIVSGGGRQVGGCGRRGAAARRRARPPRSLPAQPQIPVPTLRGRQQLALRARC